MLSLPGHGNGGNGRGADGGVDGAGAAHGHAVAATDQAGATDGYTGNGHAGNGHAGRHMHVDPAHTNGSARVHTGSNGHAVSHDGDGLLDDTIHLPCDNFPCDNGRFNRGHARQRLFGINPEPVGLGAQWSVVHPVAPDRFEIEVLRHYRAGHRGAIITNLPEDDAYDFASRKRLFIHDCDGTALLSGRTQLWPVTLAALGALEERGVLSVGSTGKPVSELEKVHRHMQHEYGEKPSKWYALAEKGAFLVEMESRRGGILTTTPLLISQEVVDAIAVIKEAFTQEWKKRLEREFHKYDVQIELSGDGRHQAAFSFDVLDKTKTPKDFREKDYGSRYDFKIHDPELCASVFRRMLEELDRASINHMLPGQYKAAPVGTAALEITAKMIDKDRATFALCKALGIQFDETTIGVAGDSLNDASNYKLSGKFPNVKAVHVVHYENVKVREQLDILKGVQFAVIGEGLMSAYLEFILRAKGCPPLPKVSQLFSPLRPVAGSPL